MDFKKEYEPLTQKLKTALPLIAFPDRGLVQAFRTKVDITLKTELTISDVFNSGDISGILCTVKNTKGQPIACALTLLVFSPGSAL